MKTQLLICLIIVILGLNHELVFSQKIYLSPSGNDKNIGTFEKPLATLNEARDRAREYRKINPVSHPIEIIALEGEYFMQQPLSLTTEDSGTADVPLIFKAENAKKAVFRGGVQLNGIEKMNEDLWRVFVPQVAYYNYYFEQLFVNGRRAVRARTPNNGFYFIKNVTETLLEKGEGPVAELAIQRLALDTTEALCFNSFSRLDFQDAVVTFFHKWDNTRKHIAGFDRQNAAIYITGTGMQPWNYLDNTTRYFVENNKSALDAPGEWYLERSGYLYYIPQEGETIENTTFFAPVLKEFIVIQGDSITGKQIGNIRFENLDFQVTGYLMPPQGNEAAQAASNIDAVVTLDFAKNISFMNCEIAHTGTYALWFRRACSNCQVNQCYMHDLGAGGVKIGETIFRLDAKEFTSSITIDNNIIRDCGNIFPLCSRDNYIQCQR